MMCQSKLATDFVASHLPFLLIETHAVGVVLVHRGTCVGSGAHEHAYSADNFAPISRVVRRCVSTVYTVLGGGRSCKPHDTYVKCSDNREVNYHDSLLYTYGSGWGEECK